MSTSQRPEAPEFGPPPRHPRYQSLDIWRGIACLMVVVYHSTGLAIREGGDDGTWVGRALVATGWLCSGVPIFFVISGYCIAATTDSSRRRRSHVDYFRRRLRRIYPPYYAAILFAFAFYLVADAPWFPGPLGRAVDEPMPPWALTAGQWLGNLTLTESWLGPLLGKQATYAISVAWTLCYEEQFYLVMGLILLTSPRFMFSATAMLAALTLALRHGLPKLGLEIPTGVFLDGGWLMFAAGVLIYHRANYGGRREAWATAFALALGIVYSVRCSNPMLQTALGFALLISLLLPWDGVIASAWVLRPLGTCGVMCYSIYLTHAPVVRVVRRGLFELGLRDATSTLLVVVPACLALSLAVAWPFHVAIERRFLNAARRPQTEPAPGPTPGPSRARVGLVPPAAEAT